MLSAAGMAGNDELRVFVRSILKRGHSETDSERILSVMATNHVKVGIGSKPMLVSAGVVLSDGETFEECDDARHGVTVENEQ